MPEVSRRTLFVLGGTALISRALTPASLCRGAIVWQDQRAHGPFHVQATFALGNLNPLFQELSNLEMELQRTLAVPAADRQIDVYLLNNQRSHKQLLAECYPRVPYRRALFVQRGNQASVFAYVNPDLPVDLRHECTHALLHSSLPMVPLWLDEGLAEYFEVTASQRSSGHPHLAKLRWSLRFGMIRSMQSLEDCGDISQMGAVEYRFAWAWVHFMLHGPLVAHRELVHFLSDIRRGNLPGQLSYRLLRKMPDLNEQFVAHFKTWPNA